MSEVPVSLFVQEQLITFCSLAPNDWSRKQLMTRSQGIAKSHLSPSKKSSHVQLVYVALLCLCQGYRINYPSAGSRVVNFQ